MITETMVVRIHVAWWVLWYLASVALTSQVTGLPPDLRKVDFWVSRGVRVREVR